MTSRRRRFAGRLVQQAAPTIVVVAAVLWGSTAGAQTVSQRGFVEARASVFAQTSPNEPARALGDALVREEVFLRPARWIGLAAGLDLRANSHRQVEDEWRLDVEDRGVLRPRAALRRLTASFNAGGLTIDIGKQFIRWGRTDVLNPTDRFAPRDFLNVIDSDLLPITGARAAVQLGQETFEAVWVPRFTPSRLPLLNQRWTVAPPEAAGIPVRNGGSSLPRESQQGIRWRHAGARVEIALAFFDGFNHLPNIEARVIDAPLTIELTRTYPDIRMYGGDLVIPTAWFTVKGEAAYITSPTSTSEQYVLYVLEVERQAGEWVLVAGYAGDAVTRAHESLTFGPERGIARSVLARVARTVDPRRTVAVEGAARQNGRGFYVKGEYSEAFGQHWRLTVTSVGITGNADDFLGQYRRNSHVSTALRFSF